jgi:hypothetical protein
MTSWAKVQNNAEFFFEKNFRQYWASHCISFLKYFFLIPGSSVSWKYLKSWAIYYEAMKLHAINYKSLKEIFKFNWSWILFSEMAVNGILFKCFSGIKWIIQDGLWETRCAQLSNRDPSQQIWPTFQLYPENKN